MTMLRNIISRLKLVPETDHRFIGAKQRLFFFDDHSKGSCFFEPRGARIYNKLVDFLRNEYRSRGYQEVITPNMFGCDLWKTSGHWDHYKQNMIRFEVGEQEYSLKPMNCPGHCVMFKKQPLIKDTELPVRWADFGVLHRNELSGSLMGLSRVRKFQQDDAHIFCTPGQVRSEVAACLKFAQDVYQMFGFSFRTRLSLRPDSYMGDTELWDEAEMSLRAALQQAQLDWQEQAGEGAFYGPKIDIIVQDSRQRSQQCATIQLDFQLPKRFELEYKDTQERKLARPVIIHRAILGSVERFIAMICENFDGRWPFWLSPLQGIVIPIHENLNKQAESVCDQFRSRGFWVDCDLRTNFRLNAKVREAQMLPYNVIMVIGEREAANKSVNVRVLLEPEEHQYQGCSEPIGEKGAEGAKKLHSKVKNVVLPVEELLEHMKDFEKGLVDRADLALLKMSGRT